MARPFHIQLNRKFDPMDQMTKFDQLAFPRTAKDMSNGMLMITRGGDVVKCTGRVRSNLVGVLCRNGEEYTVFSQGKSRGRAYFKREGDATAHLDIVFVLEKKVVPAVYGLGEIPTPKATRDHLLDIMHKSVPVAGGMTTNKIEEDLLRSQVQKMCDFMMAAPYVEAKRPGKAPYKPRPGQYVPKRVSSIQGVKPGKPVSVAPPMPQAQGPKVTLKEAAQALAVPPQRDLSKSPFVRVSLAEVRDYKVGSTFLTVVPDGDKVHVIGGLEMKTKQLPPSMTRKDLGLLLRAMKEVYDLMGEYSGE